MWKSFMYRGKRYNSKKELLRDLEKEFIYIDTSVTVFGKKYASLSEVAKAYNIKVKRLKAYIKKNKNLDLEFIVNRMKLGRVLGLYSVDFLGNEFPSATALCRYWKISPSAYFHRLELGDDLETLILGKGIKQKIKFLNTHKDFFTQEQFNFYTEKYKEGQ